MTPSWKHVTAAIRAGAEVRLGRPGRKPGPFAAALAEVPRLLAEARRRSKPYLVVLSWVVAQEERGQLADKLERYFQDRRVVTRREAGDVAGSLEVGWELYLGVDSLLDAAGAERVRRDLPAACTHCGRAPTPTFCKLCLRHACRSCAQAGPPGCRHKLARLTPVQLDVLKRLPRSEAQVRADGRRRRTYLSLERLGVAAWDLTTRLFCARVARDLPETLSGVTK